MKATRIKNDIIKIIGARVHNLQNFTCSLPINKLIVIQGFGAPANRL